MKFKTILVLALLVTVFGSAQGFVNVLDFGAIGDGIHKNTNAFKLAIEDASKRGGGTVYVPAGDYLTGPIHFKSNITLYVDAGARLKFSEDFEDYLPMVPTRFQGVNHTGFSPLIYGYEVENVAIVGQGTIDGQGDIWQKTIKELRRKKRAGIEEPPSKWQKLLASNNPNRPNLDQSGFQRPVFIQFFKSSRVKIRDVKITNAPFWTVHFVDCNDVLVDGVYIKNPEESSNTDGINPESSQNVKISNCTIDVGDDCIAIKSGKGKEARDTYNPTINIQITNCTMLHGAAGVAVGSEMSAGVENVLIENCIFRNTAKGIHIKTNRERGGYVKNVRVNNILMSDIDESHDNFPTGILLNEVYYLRDSTAYKPITESTPLLEGLHFSNITMNNVKYPIGLTGLGERKIKNVGFNNMDIQSIKGIRLTQVSGVTLSQITMQCTDESALILNNVNDLQLSDFREQNHMKKRFDLQSVSNASFLVSASSPKSFRIDGDTTKSIIIKSVAHKPLSLEILDNVKQNEITVINSKTE